MSVRQASYRTVFSSLVGESHLPRILICELMRIFQEMTADILPIVTLEVQARGHERCGLRGMTSITEEPPRTEESLEEITIRFKGILNALDLIAEKLRTKGAITLRDLEALKQQYEKESSHA